MIFPQVTVGALAVCIFLSFTGDVTSFSLHTRNSPKGMLPANVNTSLNKSHGREIFRLASTSSSTSISTSSSSSSSTIISTSTSHSAQEKIKFEMLSTNPLLFSSQKSILSIEECKTLSSWCQSIIQARGGEGNLNNNVLLQGIANQEEGALLLKRLQQILHSDLLGFDENLEEMVIPRYISYDEDEYGADMNMNANASSSSYKYGKEIQNYKVEDILPDGLHVDTNNSKFSRHWTILFYLDTCDTLGATSFPLAEVSLPKDATNVDVDLHVDEEREKMQMQRVAASKLIFEEDIQHTKYADATQDQLSIMRFVDESGLDMIQRQSESESAGQVEMGLRILPRHGHFCLFSSLSDDGYGNPLSFHGAEAMYPGETKSVLTFFYEIPMGTFGSRAELGERAKEREEKFFKFHNIKTDG
mmetsp:Transcript_27028/g.39998  ORF Transcript_27028/g.39998 Transcript_27028/m.39998 type:complete len:417 (+) Transcript_27028:152-1402(+)